MKAAKKKYRKQKFCRNWLDETNFKGWLEENLEDKFKCKCKACGKVLNCGKSELQRHASSKSHKTNVLAANIAKPVDTFFAKQNKNRDPVANFEIRLSLFFAEHNVAVNVVEHLVPLLKDIVPDSTIVKNSKLGRTKCSKIIQNVLADAEKSKLIKKLQKYKFSVLVDESTDISSNKTMCVLVRFFDEEQEKIIVQLLDLLHVGSDCSAEFLYSTFKQCILSYSIPLSNIIGLCCDGANVMVANLTPSLHARWKIILKQSR